MALGAVSLAAAAIIGSAQPVRGAGLAATRPVSHYLGLERELQSALARRDGATLDRLVDAGFEARVPPADPLARAEWLALPRRSSPPPRIHGLNVLESDGIAVVTFLYDAPLGAWPVRAVTDVWRQDKLLARSESPAAGAKAASGADTRQ